MCRPTASEAEELEDQDAGAIAQGDTAFGTVIGCHWLASFRGLHSDLAGIAVIVCRNDSVALG